MTTSTRASCQPAADPGFRSVSEAAACPSWCVLEHGERTADDLDVHVGGALLIRHTVLRLFAPFDLGSGAAASPRVLVGDDEYSLYETEALIAALTQLAEQAHEFARPLDI